MVQPWVTHDGDSVGSLIRGEDHLAQWGFFLGFQLVFDLAMLSFHLGMHSARLGLLVL